MHSDFDAATSNTTSLINISDKVWNPTVQALTQSLLVSETFPSPARRRELSRRQDGELKKLSAKRG